MEPVIEPYVFCEQNLTPYEKTILILAIAYSCNPVYSLNESNIQELSYLLEIDFQLLNKALQNELNYSLCNTEIIFGKEPIDCRKNFKNDFFNVIIKVYLMYKNLDSILDDTDNESVIENVRTFSAITDLFDITNAIVATYECIHKNAFSYDNTVFDSKELFYPKGYIDLMLILLASEDCMEHDKGLLNIITLLLKYEFRTRINALYLVTICQIFKHSPCLSSEIKSIATELYNKLLFILKNGKLLSINVNVLFCEKTKPSCKRNRFDNTTRLQLIYGYSNYDCYELRLDFSHKGQEYVHFNNETPYGLSCCIISNNEYQEIIKEFPDLNECFISYDGRWALKEEINCKLTDDMISTYDKIREQKAHDKAFFNEYSEDSINSFIEIMAHLLRKECRRPIDTEGIYSKYCFNYDFLMRDLNLLYLSYITHNIEQTNLVLDGIAHKAFKYGLTTKHMKLNSFDEVIEIIKLAEDRLV